MSNYLIWFLLAFTLPAAAAAQCIEGELAVDDACQICRNGEFESLPLRTACSDDRRVHCGAEGVYRTECIPDPDAALETTCGRAFRFGEACPSGFACADGLCLQACATDQGCQAGYRCEGGACVRIPDPDMGTGMDMGSADMSSMTDAGLGDTGTPPAPDLGRDGGADGPDGSMQVNPLPKETDSGCATAAGAARSPWFLLLALWFWRRRA